jgi:hypothetical protein
VEFGFPPARRSFRTARLERRTVGQSLSQSAKPTAISTRNFSEARFWNSQDLSNSTATSNMKRSFFKVFSLKSEKPWSGKTLWWNVC